MTIINRLQKKYCGWPVMMKCALLLGMLVCLSDSADAQWQTPNHSVPIGKGAGVTGFNSVGPCLSGVPLVGAGAASDPVCSASGALGTGAYTTAYVLPTASTSVLGGVKVDGTSITISGGIISASAGTYLPLAGGTMTGNLLFTDNTLDIGANGGTRPRTGYFGTSIVTPVVDLTGTSLVFQSAGITGTLTWSPASTNKTITLPNGTTDFTATSGVVQQASSGAAFTVGSVALTNLATQATNTILGNATAGSAAPTALAIGSCSTSSSALIWTTNTGYGCNTAISAATAATWATARNLAGNSVNGSADVAFSNKFIVQGTADTGLSGAQFLGALGTGIVKNTVTTGVLSIAIAGDFPTLNQNTTGSAATLATPRAIYGNNFDGSAALAQVIASTYGGTGNGFAKLSGPTISEKTFTLPDASATLLYDAMTSFTLGVQQTTQGSIVLANTAAGAFATTIRSSNSATAAVTYTLPTAVGTAGSSLTDAAGNGTLSWVVSGGLTINTSPISGGAAGAFLYGDGTKVQNSTGITTTGTEITITPAVNAVALTIANQTHTSVTKSLSITQTQNSTGTNLGVIFANLIPGAAVPNAASLLMDLQYNTASKFSVDRSGAVTAVGTISANGSIFVSAGMTVDFWNSSSGVGWAYNYASSSSMVGASTSKIGFTASNAISALDTILTRGGAAATFQFGAADAASPVSQTTQVQSVVAGNTNVAGVDWNLVGSKSNGSGLGGLINFKISNSVAASGSQNTATTRFSVGPSGGKYPIVAVASLPTCDATNEGSNYGVNDAAAVPIYNATVASGGSVHIPVYCNGTNWVNQ